MKITRKLNESNILCDYGNDATTMVLASLCENHLPDECYEIENRYERENCSVHLFPCGLKFKHDRDYEIHYENLWLEVQRVIDWNENEDVTVDVDDESDADDAWTDAAIDYVFSCGVREDKVDEIVSKLRALCGMA